MNRISIFFILLLLFTMSFHGQAIPFDLPEEDSAAIRQDEYEYNAGSNQAAYDQNAILPGEASSSFRPDPLKAAMFSAVIPGMGQVYNRKYWKVPIVYAGFAGLAWYTKYNHDEFVRFRNALDFRMDGNPETIDEFPQFSQDLLTRAKDYYRRQRDRTLIWTALFYALNIIDATVDAHLFEFDVSEDLGISAGPSFQEIDLPVAGRPGQMGVGIRFSLKF